MPSKVNLTLKQMSQLALGGPTMTKMNYVVLQNLIDILMKKLNCQDEQVSIGGIEAVCLSELLGQSKDSPLIFDDSNIEVITERIAEIPHMDDRLTKVQHRIECHLQEVEKCHEPQKHVWAFWEEFSSKCEDFCGACSPENDIACKLLQNVDFLRKMMRYLSTPVVERMFEMEEKIQKLFDELEKILETIKKNNERFLLLEGCIIEIEKLRNRITRNEARFLQTMEEVQEMLDDRLSKCHMPPLKKYLKDNFAWITAQLNGLRKEANCPRAAGVLMEGISCVSCGNKEIAFTRAPNGVPMLPNVGKPGGSVLHCKASREMERKRMQRKCNKETERCECGGICDHHGLSLMARIANNELLLPKANTRPSQLPRDKVQHSQKPCLGRTACDDSGKPIKLLTGSDGNLYRID